MKTAMQIAEAFPEVLQPEDNPIARARTIEHAEASYVRMIRSRIEHERAVAKHAAMNTGTGFKRNKYARHSPPRDFGNIHRPDCWIGRGLWYSIYRQTGMDISADVFMEAEDLARFRPEIVCGECHRLFAEDGIRKLAAIEGAGDDE